jgi:hypothetical protein
MSDTVLCSSLNALTLKYEKPLYSAERYSSTASTAVCCEQVFTETPDPDPATEDWFNFITAFDPTQYDAFGMTAFVTAVQPQEQWWGSARLPSNMQFRSVISTASAQDAGASATIPVDGIGKTQWTIYSTGTSETPGAVHSAHFVFTSTSSSEQGYNWSNAAGYYSESGNQWTALATPSSLQFRLSAGANFGYSALYRSIYGPRSSALATSYLFSGLTDAEKALLTDSAVWSAGNEYYREWYASASAASDNSSITTWASYPHAGYAGRDGFTGYTGDYCYSASGDIQARTVYIGNASITGLLGVAYRGKVSASASSVTSLPTYTISASASASGNLSRICGNYTGTVSASVGGFDDTQLMNPSGINVFGSAGTPYSGFYGEMRSAWDHGKFTATPYGCGLSGILELYKQTGTTATADIIASSVGA